MENQIVNLAAIQADQIEWSIRNFGQQPPHRPMLGIIEELCELEEAQLGDADETTEANVLDAVGDVAIYMLDYCGKRGWSMQELWNARACPEWLDNFVMGDENDGSPYFAPFIRRLAHSQLKGEQNIRGGTGKHDGLLKATLSSVLWTLEGICEAYYKRDFLRVLEDVWLKVRQRDWVNNPNTAHEVAEVQA
jgi:NTP pyrophosphatase (non-canonical NTP hydrolase)